MPVVVTGASGLIGRSAVRAFAHVSPQVRAYVRDPRAAERLRAEGLKAAVGRIDEGDALETVMAGAHTVCHLVGGLYLSTPKEFEQTIAASARSAAEAATRAGVRRLLYVSYPGASPTATNPFLRATGEAEEVIRASGLEYAIIRCTLVYGRNGKWFEQLVTRSVKDPVVVAGTGRQIMAPVFVRDVAQVLARADDRERMESGTWGLEGPDGVTADALADLVAGEPRRKIHLSGTGGRFSWTPIRTGIVDALRAGASGRDVRGTLLEIEEADSLTDAPDASVEFGVSRTPLREGLRRSLVGEPE